MKIMNDPRALRISLTVVAALIATVVLAWGQSRPMHSPIYNPKTETTFTGVIEKVSEVPGPGRGTGTHLVVKGDKETMEVHVGPTWYLNQKGYSFAKDDKIEVVGSKVQYGGTDVIVARKITKGDTTWTLRNEQGIPLWSRQGDRP
jgi:hypothetical protein